MLSFRTNRQLPYKPPPHVGPTPKGGRDGAQTSSTVVGQDNTVVSCDSGIRRRIGRPTSVIIALLIGLSSVLQGCGVLLVGGVATGAAVIYDRRSSQVVLDDQTIALQAVDLAQKNPDIGEHSRITTTSYNHVALLTGQAETAAISDRYAAMVGNLPKVTKVVNEVTVGPTASIAQASEDTYITSRAKFAISQVDLPGFDATRVKVVTESNVVYLMGLVSPDEANATTEKVRYIPGVERVVTLFEDVGISREES